MIYVGPSQAIIRNISDPLPSSVADPLTASVAEEKQYQQCIIRSKKNYEITDIRIMGRDNRYTVGIFLKTQNKRQNIKRKPHKLPHTYIYRHDNKSFITLIGS